MNDDREEYIEELQSQNDPIEQWPTNKLKKEANSGDDGMDQNIVIDDIGIE